MRRIIKIQGALQEEKFELQEEYEGFGIYQRRAPTGYLVHQEWLITNGELTIVIYSYNQYCRSEVKDAIDNHNEIRKFGLRVMPKGDNTYIVHRSGTCNI